MKILQVVPFFSPAHGGSAAVPYYISKELAKRGHEVTLFTSNYKLSLEWTESLHQVHVYPFKTRLSLAKFYVTPSMVKHARQEVKHFDLIHMHSYRSFQNLVAHYYARKYDVPYVLQAHGTLPRNIPRQKLKWIYDSFFGLRLLKGASKVIALSDVEVKQYKDMGVSEKKVCIIPNGIDLSEYRNLPPKGSFKKEWEIPEDKKMILCLGRIHRNKGIDFLVRAQACLIRGMKLNNALLVIAGPDDGYLSQVKSLVGGLGLSDKVLFMSMLSEEDKIAAYVDSSIVVNVEPENVFGLVPLEAAACSTPVIVSSGNAISKVIREGGFGFSVSYGEIVELAEAMHKLLTSDNSLKEMGQGGRKFIFENYDWASIVPKLEKIYEEVLYSRLNSSAR